MKIRLRRMGTKKKVSYKVVVCDSRNSVQGKYIESLGTYNPRQEPPLIIIDRDKVKLWRSKGAQVSDTVQFLLSGKSDSPSAVTAVEAGAEEKAGQPAENAENEGVAAEPPQEEARQEETKEETKEEGV